MISSLKGFSFEWFNISLFNFTLLLFVFLIVIGVSEYTKYLDKKHMIEVMLKTYALQGVSEEELSLVETRLKKDSWLNVCIEYAKHKDSIR